MLQWLSRLLGRRQPNPAVESALRVIRARYDAARTTEENRKHWAAADGLSADAANSPEVRRLLRNRARYEVANNCYAKGMVLTLANDVVGTGPRLQMLLPDGEANRRVEWAFSRWARAVGLAGKLRTMRMARVEDGEAFALLVDNPRIRHEVTLDLRLVEADQVTTPDISVHANSAVDGIVFDEWGNPVEYHLLKEHPGDTLSHPWDYSRLAASSVLHYLRRDRPGQSRGVPDLTPALPLFAQLRRYTLAVLTTSEIAAVPSGVLYTDAPANGEADAVEPMDLIELERGMLMTMPGGWKLGQIRAEQPTAEFSAFTKQILNEIARCLEMPFNITAGNSSGYNYASGRLDHQTYQKSIRVERSLLQATVLDPLLAAWFDEAAMIPGLLPEGLGPFGDWDFQIFFDGHEHVDPMKESRAQSIRLASHTTTLSSEYARQGLDWETQLRQRAKELELMRDLGLTDDAVLPTSEDEDVEDQVEEAVEEATETAGRPAA